MESDNRINHKRWIDQRLAILLPEPEWQPDVMRGLRLLHAARERRPVHRSMLVWAAFCSATLVLALAGLPSTRLLAARYVSACMNLLGRQSAEAPSLAYTAPIQRKPAPDLTVKNSDESPARLSDYRGRVVLMTFWKSNCVPCATEMTWFKEFQQKYPERNFTVLNQELTDGSEDVLGLFGDRKVIPTTLLIDKAGRIAVTHLGLCTKREYQTAIESLLNEQ